ncbi:MAG: 6-phosphogluconolactonase [Candidatus Marinimicrobia bacterium]|nr:6-phosphogluconolactonase [Candidatus Neomarinimicrobiota bacterium]
MAINNARTVVFMVSGDSKAEILNQVLSQSGESFFYPSQLIKPVSGQLIVLIDKAAVRAIS